MQPSIGKLPPSRTALVAAILFLATAALFWPVGKFEFVGYDDPFYVTQNPHVTSGLTGENIAWAFGRVASEATYWHPLSWISHMLDCQLFGLNSGAHHLMSVLFHGINVILLFLVLQKFTGGFWRSAVVAALFALHPLQVESVAWVTERKNLLSTLFLFLTLLAYARFVRRSESCIASSAAESEAASGEGQKECPVKLTISRMARPDYILVLVCFALGLMSKPMLVTVPCVLLLLDFWPLRRFESAQAPKSKLCLALVVEKIPFFILSAASSWITIVAHQKLQYVASQNIPFSIRIGNAVLSYIQYIENTLLPKNLAAIYPYRQTWAVTEVVIAALLLLGITAFFFTLRRTRPFLIFGWLWFLGTLVPVIGLLQVGAQAMADRFVYVPVIGLFIIASWSVAEVCARAQQGKMLAMLAGTMAAVACFAVSQRQLPFWKNSNALFERALAVTKDNVVAHYNLGLALSLERKTEEASKQYAEALRISPNYIDARNNLAGALFAQDRFGEAAVEYKKVLETNPKHPLALFNLGIVFERAGDIATAEKYYRQLTQAHPANFEGWSKLAVLFGSQGKNAEANGIISEMLRANKDSAQAHMTAGELYMAQQKFSEAFTEFLQASTLQPKNAFAHYNAANALGMMGRTTEAVAHLNDAVRLNPRFAEAHYTLGAAAAEQGKVEEAVQSYKQAIKAEPKFVPALVNLSWILANHKNEKIRDANQALQLAGRAVEVTSGNDASAMQSLAAAYAASGKLGEALQTAQKALTLAETNGAPQQLEQIRNLVENYKQKRPLQGL